MVDIGLRNPLLYLICGKNSFEKKYNYILLVHYEGFFSVHVIRYSLDKPDKRNEKNVKL